MTKKRHPLDMGWREEAVLKKHAALFGPGEGKSSTLKSIAKKLKVPVIKLKMGSPNMVSFAVNDIVSCAGQQNWGQIVNTDRPGLYVLFRKNQDEHHYLGTFSYDELVAMRHATNFDIPEAHYREYYKGIRDGEEKKEAVIRKMDADLANAKAALDTMVKRNNTLDGLIKESRDLETETRTRCERLQAIVSAYINGTLEG